jgi:hypothetical protein
MTDKLKVTRKINFFGRDIELVASFKGMQEIEKAADAGLVSILHRAGKKDIRIGDMAAIIYGGMLGNRSIRPKDQLSLDAIGESLTNNGVLSLVEDCLLFLSDIVMAGHKEQAAGEAQGEHKNLEHG